MASPDIPPNLTWSSGGILMSASPAKSVPDARKVKVMRSTARIHEFVLAISAGAYWLDALLVCQAFFITTATAIERMLHYSRPSTGGG